MTDDRRHPVRQFPDDWKQIEPITPFGGGEPREEGFSRPSHATSLLSGARQAILSKPKDPIAPDPHVYFAARTWKDRPSLRRNFDSIQARVHRVLPDGALIASWRSSVAYDETKRYIAQYSTKNTKTADLDYIESIRGLDHRDKLGRSLIEVLERQDELTRGIVSIVFYPEYKEFEVDIVITSIRENYENSGLNFGKMIQSGGKFTTIWDGPLYLCDEIARRAEAVAVVEQVGEFHPASAPGASVPIERNLTVSVRSGAPEFGVFDSGVSSSNPLLQGILLSGSPTVDHVDSHPDGGHGTFVAGLLAYGESPLASVQDGVASARALIHPRKVQMSGVSNGINLDSYDELANVIEQLRPRTKVFTASLAMEVPIDSDNVGPLAVNLDLLARRYDVIFVLPTGNLPNRQPDGTLSPNQPDYHGDFGAWCGDPNARLARPSESFNALTVASLVETRVADERANPGHIAPYSRRGPGPKNSPKPDVCASGGNCRVLIDQSDSSFVKMDVADHPGASISGLSAPAGEMKAFGTSFAVPKVAFLLGRLVDLFWSLGENEVAILAKAYLVHVTAFPQKCGPFPENWSPDECQSSRHLLYGHGSPDLNAIDGVPPSELCYYSAEEIGRRQRHMYQLNFPINVLNRLPELRMRVTLAYFTKVNPEALDAELYSLVELTPVVRWGEKTLSKIPRAASLWESYPLKSFEVRFSKPREGEPSERGVPTVEVTMKDRVLEEDDFRQKYALIISLTTENGELLLQELVPEIEQE